MKDAPVEKMLNAAAGSQPATDSSKDENLLYCSFCGKSQKEVRKLIAGPTVFICDECTELCEDIIWESDGSRALFKVKLPAASAIDDVLFDSLSELLRERFPDIDLKYECRIGSLEALVDKSSTIAVFSMTKSLVEDTEIRNEEVRAQLTKEYQDLRTELIHVIEQLSVANKRFIHESDRCRQLEKDITDLRGEYLDHLRKFAAKMAKEETQLRAVMFIDVSGFSRLKAAERERVLDMLRAMTPTILEHAGGHEINMWGDGIVATFNDPSIAIEAGARFIRQLSVEQMDVRIGMAWGEVRIAFNPATARRDIDGDAVNFAARLEPLAPVGGILASADFGGLKIKTDVAELVPVNVVAKKAFAEVEAGQEFKAYQVRILKN